MSLQAQDIEAIAKAEPLAFSGSLRVGADYYHINGDEPRRLPFSYIITGTPTLSIYGVDLPVAITYRDGIQDTRVQSPFNRYGIAPRYKWARLFIGQHSPRLGNYSLRGKNLGGIGTELTPGKFRFALHKGKLDNFIPISDSLNYSVSLIPAFPRDIWAGKIGYGGGKFGFDLSCSKIKDLTDDSFEIQDSNLLVLPQENLVMELDISTQITRKWIFEINGAGSLYTENLSSNSPTFLELDAEVQNIQKVADPVIQPNLSTRWGFAGDAKLKYRFPIGNIGMKYRRVDPFFNSLGSIYIQRDIEEITGEFDLSLLKRRLRLQASAGLQRNNLANFKTLGSQRKIGAVNLNYTPNTKFFLNARYSNFTRDVTPGLYELNDTLRQTNITQLAGMNTGYRIDGSQVKTTISLNMNYQIIEDISPLNSIDSEITAIGLGLSVSNRFKTTGLRITPSIRYNISNTMDFQRNRWVFGLQYAQPFLDKKLRIHFGSNYALNITDGKQAGHSIFFRSGVRYQFRPDMGIRLNANYNRRTFDQRSPIAETQIRIGFNFSF